MALSVATGALLARTLGPAGRGEYALALLGQSLAVLLANLGISNALTYYLARREFSIERLIAQTICLALILGGIAAVALTGVAAMFGRVLLPGVPSDLVVIAAVSVPLGLFFYFTLSFSQGLEKFGAFNGLYIANAVALLVFLVPLLWARGNVTFAVSAWSLSWLPPAVLGLIFLARWGRLNVKYDPSLSRRLFSFGIVGYLSYVTNYLNVRLDTFLVNIFTNAAQVGFYAVAVTLAESLWYVSTAAATVLAPRVAAGETVQSDETTGRVFRVVVFGSVVAAVCLALTAPWLVQILFGSAFRPSVAGVWLLLPGIVALGGARVLGSYLLGRNRQQVDLVATLAGLVATVALDVLLIPRYGFLGAAVASSVAYTVTLAVDLGWIVSNTTLTLRTMLIPTTADVGMTIRRLRGMWLDATRLRS